MRPRMRVVVWLLLAVAAVGCAGMPDPHLIRTEVGKYAVVTAGQGTPALVLEANLGNGSAVWAPLFDDLAQTTRVLGYDRAGNGGSMARSNDRSAAQIVRELHSLLEVAGIGPPYVLVSHSLGNRYVELFARTYPNEVAGVVFLDGLYQDYVLACFPMSNPAAEFCPASSVMRETFDAVPNAGDKEYNSLRNASEQLRMAGPFPAVPVAVVSGTRLMTGGNADRDWLEEQQRLLKLSPRGRQIVCKDCGYAVQYDNPGLVVRTIREIVAESRVAKN